MVSNACSKVHFNFTCSSNRVEMRSRKLRSRVVISKTTVPSKQSNVKLKQTKISDWLGSRSDDNCSEDNLSDPENSFQICSSSSSSESVSEVTSAPLRKGSNKLKDPSNSTTSNGADSTTIVLQVDGILTCDFPKCSYQTSFKANLEKHKKIKHELKRLKCPHCEYVTHSKVAFTRHRSSHGRKSFKCRLCDWTTAIRDSLKQHMKQTHERAKLREQGITRATEFGKRFKCSKCDFRAVGKQEIHLHNYSHETDRKHKCSFSGCDYRAKTVSSLREHMRRHDGEAKKEFQCQLCFKVFWNRSMLSIHIQSHTKEWTVHCPKCKYVTNFPSSLRKHMRTHDRKPDNATDKQNAGESLGELNHEPSHENSGTENSRSKPRRNQQDRKKSIEMATEATEEIGPVRKKPKKVLEKKHKCEQCDFTAIYKCKIIRHAVVHRNPDDKIYSCSFTGCDFKTNWEDYVQKHYRDFHKSVPDLACPVEGCGFKTKWKDVLAIHKRNHEKKRKRDHQCPLCRKAFYDSQGLKRHINIHTQENKYKCPLCDYLSGEGSNFYAHRRKYHPGQKCEPIRSVS